MTSPNILRTGRNAHAGAGGAMADVITYSTSLMSDADRHAIAIYLKSQAGEPERRQRSTGSGRDAPRRRHLLGRLRLLPPGKRRRPTAILSAARATTPCCSRRTRSGSST